MLNIQIVIATYNNIDKLDNALISAFKQQGGRKYSISICVVDDGSEEFSKLYIEKKIDEISKRHNNAHYWQLIKHEKNLGTVASLNKAILCLEFDYCVLLAADDEFIGSDVISKIAGKHLKEHYEVITIKRAICKDGEYISVKPTTYEIKLLNKYDNKKTLQYICTTSNFLSGSSTSFSRKVFESIGPFDEKYRLMEDLPFFSKALHKGIKVGVLEDVCLKYNTGGVSSSNMNIHYINDKNTFDSVVQKNDYLTPFNKRYAKFLQHYRTERYKAMLFPDQLIIHFLKKYYYKVLSNE